MEPVTKSKAVMISGLDPRTVQFYTDRGAVTPIEGGGSRGVKLKYNKDGLFMLCLIKQMYDFGMTIETITDVARWVEKNKMLRRMEKGIQKHGDVFFVTVKIENGKAIAGLHEYNPHYDTISRIMADDDSILVIDAGKILDHLNR